MVVNVKSQPASHPKGRRSLLCKLFISTLYLSTFTFGGGYVIITLMKKKFVDEYHWIDEQEMLDLVAIAQSSPGAIAVNGAIVVGYKLAGMAGVLTSVLATVIPPPPLSSSLPFPCSMRRSAPTWWWAGCWAACRPEWEPSLPRSCGKWAAVL